jgi:vacuolar-type H+-ATPase subunit E/Vma4
MSLKHILEALEAEARGQIKEIEGQGEGKVRDILNESQERITAMRSDRQRAVQEDLRIEEAQILNHAKLQAQQEVMKARETLIEGVLKAVHHRLQNISTSTFYLRLLELLTLEAVDALKTAAGLQVRVRDGDVNLMRGIIENLGLSATVAGGVDCTGGVLVSSTDGRIRVDNTLDIRLRQAASLYRSHIAEIVLG